MLSQELIYDEDFNKLSIQAQNLFTRMLAVSDDYGVIPANEYTLRSLTNPHPDIAKKLMSYLAEIIGINLGVVFTYQDRQYFIFKRESFDRINSYVLAKRTKSEYLRLEKEFMESEKFQEILRSSSKDLPTSIISNKYKVISNKQKVMEITHDLQKWVLENCKNVSKLENQLTAEESEKLLSEFGGSIVQEILISMDNYKPLLTKYKSVDRTLRNWIKLRLEKNNGNNKGHNPKNFVSPERVIDDMHKAF